MYNVQAYDSSFKIDDKYQSIVDLMESFVTFNKLLNIDSDIFYDESFLYWKVQYIGPKNKLIVFFYKKDNLVDLEFAIDYENLNLKFHKTRNEIFDYFENKYDFDIDKDYFSSSINYSPRSATFHFKINSIIKHENLVKFCSDLLNNRIDDGIV